MWEAEDGGLAPWQLLISARYLRQIDSTLAAVIERAIEPVAADAARRAVITASTQGVELSAQRPTPTSDARRRAAVVAVLDFDEAVSAAGRIGYPGSFVAV